MSSDLSFVSGGQLQRAGAEAFDFDSYLDWYRTNGAWPAHPESMRRKYQQIVVPEEERDAVRRIAGNYRLFALVDIGCPWVAANLTIVSRVVESSPAIELRILHRTAHLDLAYAFPVPMGASTYVLVDEKGDELAVHAGTLGTPADVLKSSLAHRDECYREFAEHFPGTDALDLPNEYLADVLEESIEWRWAFIDRERAGVVQWLVGAAAGLRPTVERDSYDSYWAFGSSSLARNR